jgi:hypothetical protein
VRMDVTSSGQAKVIMKRGTVLLLRHTANSVLRPARVAKKFDLRD